MKVALEVLFDHGDIPKLLTIKAVSQMTNNVPGYRDPHVGHEELPLEFLQKRSVNRLSANGHLTQKPCQP